MSAVVPMELVPPRRMSRKPTLTRQFVKSGTQRRRSFLMELQDQMDLQRLQEEEREKQQEITNLHRVLEKPPETRDAVDIDSLYDWVMRNGSTNKIFQGAQEIICKTICREMTLLELPAKGPVCYQGDYGDIFYIIITGSVSLYLDPKRSVRAETHPNPKGPGSENQASVTQETYRQKRPVGVDGENDAAEVRPESFGSLIKQIGAGGTFGELAVMDPTARRSCTIICDVTTSFICLKRGAYQRLIRITNSSHLDFTQAEFLETLFFFERWPHTELTRVSNRLRNMTFATDTYLSKIGSEANLVFFIYAGVVQETVPLVQYLNGNGNIHRCSTVETETALRAIQGLSINDRRQKQPQQRRRIALELNLYQDHDICGEYPIFCNKTLSNTDLLAITDVKALVMDRETWKDVFYMHGLEHIKEAFVKLRRLAQARENWRQTRIKLALSNPGLNLTISTKAMMQDGKCMCGWCGSQEHITGDLTCPTLLASKQRQADKQQKKKAPPEMITAKAHAVKNTLHFVNELAETASRLHRKESAIAMGWDVEDFERPKTPRTPSSSRPSSRERPVQRHKSLKTAAQEIIRESKSARTSVDETPETLQPTPPISFSRQSTRTLNLTLPPVEVVPSSLPKTPEAKPVLPINVAASHRVLSKAGSLFNVHKLSTDEPSRDEDEDSSQPLKVEEVRKTGFTEELEAQYRQEMLRKMKRSGPVTLEDYYEVRGQVLESIQDSSTLTSEERFKAKPPPRKPKIPKPNRRLAMCSKNREPRPDRFNRKINRMLKKMWKHDHPLPVVEESL
ncbi:hypothetical protein Poli38472_005348 [Pythium oligandrum]|uniref:Cyclic nucleotide-binding domain-containing protein n=1 Tax=Pythium oligandrum TaxID=41045 RepID=A0A8K1FGG1_PYTOL|nr:hypothetical protein Poli38472_005348 [Pythium oligandrum]|eukprot:TMW62730.1 hypothetical protein Poli38472_005348 [Pythium oligandrum]